MWGKEKGEEEMEGEGEEYPPGSTNGLYPRLHHNYMQLLWQIQEALPVHPPSKRIPILLFSQTFLLKSAVSEVGAPSPQRVGAPQTGNPGSAPELHHNVVIPKTFRRCVFHECMYLSNSGLLAQLWRRPLHCFTNVKKKLFVTSHFGMSCKNSNRLLNFNHLIIKMNKILNGLNF